MRRAKIAPLHSSLGDRVRLHLKKEKKMMDWAQCLTPIIPTLSETKVGESLEPRTSTPAWATWRNPISTKKNPHTYTQKLAGCWWHLPVIPVTQEAEAGESITCAQEVEVIVSRDQPLHSSLGDRVRLYLKKKDVDRPPVHETQ